MSSEIRTISDCIGVLQAAIPLTPLHQDARLNIEDVRKIIAVLEAAEKT
jgi:hypothetical protein